MKRHCFNLIELCLFLIFLALISSVLSLNAPKILQLQKNKSERNAFEGLLQAASDWVLFSEADLHLRFSFVDHHLLVDISSDAKDVSPPFEKQTSFSTFESLEFISTQDPRQINKISSSKNFDFFEVGLSDNGGLQAPLHLVLNSSKQKPLIYFFPGYPHVFQTQE